MRTLYISLPNLEISVNYLRKVLYQKLRGAKEKMQSAQTLRTVPREYLKAPGGLNPNVLMTIAAIVLLTVSTVGYFFWGFPAWCSFTANVLALHLSGTVIHDASHNSAHSNRIVNSILGHCSALMLGFAFPVFTRVHLQHHAHVNDPENDPDHFVSTGGPLWLIAARFLLSRILSSFRESFGASMSY